MKQLRLFLFILSMFAMSNMSAQIIYDYFEYTIIGDGEVELTGVENFDDWSNIGTIVFVPETIYDENGSEYTVTAIGEGAFATSLIESIWLPSTIKKIGDAAFCCCESLVYVNYDGELKLEELGQSAFAECPNLSAAYFLDDVREIKPYTYYQCNQITSLSIINKDNIGECAFSECEGLSSLTISNVNNIDYRAFADCPNLESISFINTIGKIGGWVFFSCESLTEIAFWNGAKSIGEHAFGNCEALKRISFVRGYVERFEEGAFNGCYNLSDVYINNIIKYCSAEFGNSSASPFHRGAKLHYVEGTAFSGPEHPILDLSQFNIPYIGANAFYHCSNITKLALPEGLTSIGNQAFFDCSALTSVTIPSTLNSVADNAFNGVGTQEDPCEMIAPAGYPFGVSTTGNYFLWKSGYFWMEAKDYLTADAGDIIKEGKSTLTVSLNNLPNDYNGFQFDVQLPEGVTIDTDNYTLSDRYSNNGMKVIINLLANGNYRVFCYSITNTTITGTEGELITLVLNASDTAPSGNNSGSLKNIMLSGVNGENTKLPDAAFTINVSEYVLGDVNNDNVISVTDVMMIVNFILGNNSGNPHIEYADIDFDGEITIDDVMSLIQKVLTADYLSSPANGCSTVDVLNASPSANGYDLTLNNADTYTSFQMDIHLPQGSTLKNATIDDARANGHKIWVRRLSADTYRLLGFSLEGNELRDHQGTLLHLNIEGGSNGLSVENIHFVTNDLNTVKMDDVAGIPTSINEISLDNTSKKYTLSGTEATSATKGVLISNGRKYVRR